ncbi:hypothetical protein WJX73_008916 [Symbiochloris irregularis]|uniref:SCP2 domain-containing protein n=1 Tax=Symbiochloris irregularis TaxID=706552 RepID=A0AAW1NTM5_9CHLO
MSKPKAAEGLFERLRAALKTAEGDELKTKVKGLIVFHIDDEKWALDLRPGKSSVEKGAPKDKPDLTLTITDENFLKLTSGKLGPQQAFLMRKLKISGSMALALKLQPILDAAAPPKSKL